MIKKLINRLKIWWYEPTPPVMESHKCDDHRVIDMQPGYSKETESKYTQYITSCSVCGNTIHKSPWFNNETKKRKVKHHH